LKVVGSGPQLKRLRKMAGPTVEFSGIEPTSSLQESFARCRALLFPGEEDFGMVPIEAQSFGRPVLAYGSGGSLETVRGCWPEEPLQSGHTGIFFKNQTEADVEAAIVRFESVEGEFCPDSIAAHARQFGSERFRTEMQVFLSQSYQSFQKQRSKFCCE
jgi:glycosyltransferase involved in cell wall biosynthesis